MKINVLAVGKLKAPFTELSKEYAKMISKFAEITVFEIKEEKVPLRASAAQIKSALDKEAEAILKKINKDDYVFALSPQGEELDSVQFSAKLQGLKDTSNKDIVFAIGSSHGLGEAVYTRANTKLSFGKMTFPHQLFRVMLLEQIFRAFKIMNNETYHK